MSRGGIIRRIALAALFFGVLLTSVFDLVAANRTLALTAWPIDVGSSNKVMLGVESFVAERDLQLFVVARPDARRLRRSDEEELFRSTTLRIGVTREGYTDEYSTEQCEAFRVRRPPAYRGALRCDLDALVLEAERVRILVGGTVAAPPDRVRYELVGVPVAYLETRARALTTAIVFGVLYLLAGRWVVGAVRKYQAANTP